MYKIDRIFNYLNKNKHKDREQLVKEISKEFCLTLHSAKSYHSKWITHLKKNGQYKDVQIILLPLDIRKTLEEELDKCIEEEWEFLNAVNNKDIENIIEEFWDTIQVKLNIMNTMGISTKRIYKDLNKHLDKMRQRGYTFKTEGRW